jgi:hypothetical protein
VLTNEVQKSFVQLWFIGEAMTNLDLILQNPESMKQWLSTGEAKVFTEWLKATVRGSQKALRESKDLIELYRAQGALELAERILALREQVNDYLLAQRKKN